MSRRCQPSTRTGSTRSADEREREGPSRATHRTRRVRDCRKGRVSSNLALLLRRWGRRGPAWISAGREQRRRQISLPSRTSSCTELTTLHHRIRQTLLRVTSPLLDWKRGHEMETERSQATRGRAREDGDVVETRLPSKSGFKLFILHSSVLERR